MSIRVGTVGWSHAEWKGSFYPENISQKQMLAYYAERFSTVEVGYTFRQMPCVQMLETWESQAPESFRFCLKAWQTITHLKRLRNVEHETDNLLDAATALRDQQGPIVFQLPPSMKINVPTLDTFLKHIGGRAKVAIECRHGSWFGNELYDCLRAHSAALCYTEGDSMPSVQLVRTTDWGYVRFRDNDYTDARLLELLEQIRHQWDECYVFYTHEGGGLGPKFAARFLELSRA